MNGDILFRTMPIGGFNKEDVIEYISGLQKQISDYKKEIADKDRMIQDARRRENALTAQLKDYSSKADEYFNLSEKYKKKVDKDERKIESLEKTISTIEIDFERTKDVEGQIGALVIDALLYSDKIIQSAKSSASEISSGTKATLEKAVSGVGEIGSDITEISENFGDIIESLSKKLNELSSNLTGVADSLDESEAQSEEKKYVFGENSDVRMPKLSEKDFDAQAEDEDDISQEEIDELLKRLNITMVSNDEVEDAIEEKENVEESVIPVEIEEIEIKAEPQEEKVKEKEPDYSEMDIDDLLNDVDSFKSKKQGDPIYRPSEFEVSDAVKDDMLNEDISKLMNKFLDSDK